MELDSWQILDVGSPWLKEFAAAMTKSFRVAAWEPVMRYAGAFERWERAEQASLVPLQTLRFPLQRGYTAPWLRSILPFEAPMIRRLEAHCTDPGRSPLLCTTPFYAPVAERWRGPLVYYATDFTAAYDGMDPAQVKEFDRRMCRAVHVVCSNSRRLAAYFIEQAGCPEGKITIVPNATRESNILPAPLLRPEALPLDMAHLPRPIAGILGNLAGNMNWELLRSAIERTPWLHWVFIGPTDMPIRDAAQARARAWSIQHAHFLGARPYGDLHTYARCLDVAVLPYCVAEPTLSGSSTRFYEHLAACRPMLATRGCAELLEKPPLLELVDTAEDMAEALERLRVKAFHDGFEAARWEASLEGTWEERVRRVVAAALRVV